MKVNKAVYTATPVAGGWAGAVMSWAGVVMSWAGAVKAARILKVKVWPTDRPTTVRYGSRCLQQWRLLTFLLSVFSHSFIDSLLDSFTHCLKPAFSPPLSFRRAKTIHWMAQEKRYLCRNFVRYVIMFNFVAPAACHVPEKHTMLTHQCFFYC